MSEIFDRTIFQQQERTFNVATIHDRGDPDPRTNSQPSGARTKELNTKARRTLRGAEIFEVPLNDPRRSKPVQF